MVGWPPRGVFRAPGRTQTAPVGGPGYGPRRLQAAGVSGVGVEEPGQRSLPFHPLPAGRGDRRRVLLARLLPAQDLGEHRREAERGRLLVGVVVTVAVA